MDFRVRNNRIDLWEGDKHIGTISINYYKRKFRININGMCNDGTTFFDSKGLKRYITKQCVLKINIPQEIYDYINSIAVMFKLI